MKRLLIALACMLCVGAAPKGKEITGSIALATANPAFGSTAYFDYAPTSLNGAPRSQPRILVVCYQGNVSVYAEILLDPSLPFVLGGASSPWYLSPGPAHCVATLFYWDFSGKYFNTQVNLAVSEFDAADPR